MFFVWEKRAAASEVKQQLLSLCSKMRSKTVTIATLRRAKKSVEKRVSSFVRAVLRCAMFTNLGLQITLCYNLQNIWILLPKSHLYIIGRFVNIIVEKCLRIYVPVDFIVSLTKFNFIILLIKSIFLLNKIVSKDQVFFTRF